MTATQLVATLATRLARVVLARLGPGSLRRPAPRPRTAARARRHRHGALAADDAPGARSRATAPSSSRGSCSSTWRDCCRRREVTIEYRAGGRRRAHLERALLVEAERLRGRGLSPAPVGRRAAARRSRRPSLLETVDRVRAVGVEGRVAAGADRDPGALRGHAARRWPRPTRTGSRSRRRSSRQPARTSRRSSRPARSPSSPGSPAARRPSRSASTRTTSSSGPATRGSRPAASTASSRTSTQLLPETFEVEVDLPRAELRDVVRRAGVMALRNAPLRLRFAEGELTISAQSQDVGETRESLAGRLYGRAARDRLQRGVPPRRRRVGDVATRCG